MAEESLRRPRRDEEVDVAIVCAGPSGSVAALHLARAGFSVVVLEQGGWPDYADYTGARPEHELVSTKVWHPNRMSATTLGTIPSTLRLRTSIPSCLPGWAGAPRCTGRSGCISCHRTSVSARSTASPRTGLSLTKICFRFSLSSNARSACPDYRAIRHSAARSLSLSSAPNGFGRKTRSARDGTHGLALVAGKQRHPIREVRGT